MKRINWKKDIILRVVTILFFAAFLLIGLSIYRDYGIACDEIVDHLRGETAFNFMTGQGSVLADKHYGASFEIVLIVLEKLLGLGDPQAIVYLRHLAVFLTFYIAVICFYFLVKRFFLDRKWSLFASACLVISPRIFSHSFYNNKDLVFLSLFIMAILTMFYFVKKPNFFHALAHGFLSGFLIDVRVLGILIPAMTIGFLAWEHISGGKNKSDDKSKETKTVWLPYIFTYIFTIIVLVLIFWPFLWIYPIKNFFSSLMLMSRYSLAWPTMYLGEYVAGATVPWHYVFVWMLITIPILYIVGFGLFFVWSIKEVFFKKNNPDCKTNYTIVLIWFWLPIMMVIGLDSTIYNGWRHLYFVYPAFIILSVSGFYFLEKSGKRRLLSKSGKRTIDVIFILLFLVSFSSSISFIARNHPNEGVYFNYPARKIFAPLRSMFHLDYWGLSFRGGLEYILSTDPREEIKIKSIESPGLTNIFIMPREDRRRIKYVPQIEQADYLITSYYFQNYDYKCLNEVYKKEVEGEKILSVCKF